MTNADVELLECVEVYVLLDRRCNIVGSLVSLLCVLQLLELSLDSLVLNLLEEQRRCAELMTRLEQLCRTELSPVGVGNVEHLAQTCRAERQERLESNLEVSHELQREVKYGLYALHVGLCHVPRLAVGDVLITDACEVHSLLLCVAELECVEQCLHLLLHVLELLDSLEVYLLKLAALRHNTVEILLCELQGAVDEIAVNSHKLVVVAVLEVLPCEVVVLCLRRICRENIAQNVLLAGEVDEILVEPYSPVARCRNLVVLEVEELVRRHVVGQDIVAVSLQHGREDDAVEHYVVLADEVDEARCGVLPPLLPRSPLLGLCVAKLLGVRDVADWRVKPHVEHLAFCALYRYWDTPVEVACHSARLQIHVEPRLALSVYVRTPLLVVFQNPLLQPILPLVERQVPVLCGFLHESVTRVVLVCRVDKLLW